MSKKIFAFIVIVVVVLVAIGVFALQKSNNGNSSYPTSNTPSKTSSSSTNNSPSGSTINIRNMMFTPSQITIQKGGTVTWTNNDTTTHTVIDDLSNVGGPSSGDIAPGSSYSFTFNKIGSFQYHCRIHPSMRGTIVVK